MTPNEKNVYLDYEILVLACFMCLSPMDMRNIRYFVCLSYEWLQTEVGILKNSLRVVIAEWLNSSQRNRDRVGMNRSARG